MFRQLAAVSGAWMGAVVKHSKGPERWLTFSMEMNENVLKVKKKK